MPGHITTLALAMFAVTAPAHSPHAHLPLSRHVAAASSFRPPAQRPRALRHHHRAHHRRTLRHHQLAHAAGDPAVTIADFHFTPPTTTVHVGDTITWTNDGPSSHTATAKDGSFNTGTLSQGQSAAHTFTRAGTFAYVCTIHPFMHGTITVLGAPTTAPTTTTSSTLAPAGGTTTAPGPTTTAATSSAAPSRAATPQPTLPATGMDVLGAIAVGDILVGCGLALRRAVVA